MEIRQNESECLCERRLVFAGKHKSHRSADLSGLSSSHPHQLLPSGQGTSGFYGVADPCGGQCSLAPYLGFIVICSHMCAMVNYATV